MKNKNFYAEIPFVRAVACLLVVMVHVTAISYNPTVGFNTNINLYLNQFSRFGTPVFAVISSFLLYSSVLKRGFNFKKFLYSRTTKIIIPFIIWTLFYLGIQLAAGTQVLISLKQLLSYFIFGEAYYHLYFMVLVIQFYLVFPLLQKLVNKKIL